MDRVTAGRCGIAWGMLPVPRNRGAQHVQEHCGVFAAVERESDASDAAAEAGGSALSVSGAAGSRGGMRSYTKPRAPIQLDGPLSSSHRLCELLSEILVLHLVLYGPNDLH